MGPTWATKHRISHGWHLVMSWTQPGTKTVWCTENRGKGYVSKSKRLPPLNQPSTKKKVEVSEQVYSWFRLFHFLVTAGSPFGNRTCAYVDYVVGFQESSPIHLLFDRPELNLLFIPLIQKNTIFGPTPHGKSKLEGGCNHPLSK